MNEYRIRNGIVLEEILGKYLLISTEAVREKCAYIRVIEPIVAYYWDMMEQGLSIEEMVNQAASVFADTDKDILNKDIRDLIEELKESGYLLKDDEAD